MKKFLIISIAILTFSILRAQSNTANWVPITVEKDKSLLINVTSLSNFTGNEIYVWCLEEMNSPMSMEEVNGDIYKVRTYYHINKEINRYSILQIIFYDSKSNVLKQYSYKHASEKPEFKFSHPITRNSDVDKILAKCLEYLNQPIEKK